MAKIEQWDVFGVAIYIEATAETVTRISSTQYQVKLNVFWKTYWGGNTNYGMKATSGGKTTTITAYNGDNHKSGSGSLTGTYSISGNGSANKTITVTFEAYKTDVTTNSSKKQNVNVTVTVPAWTSYKITYNANGGSGAPSSQTKWKNQALTLSSTRPTRTGYTFLGWSTSSSATTATYSDGDTYPSGSNANATLYAVWKIITYPVTYYANANNVSNLPGSQTKEYGNTLKLSSAIPTRPEYEFLGWATSASATAAQYPAGSNYTPNADAKLYAVWKLAYVKPRINVKESYRCDYTDSTKPIDDGEFVLLEFDWSTTYNNPTVTYRYSWANGSEEHTVTFSGMNGTHTILLGVDPHFRFASETTYELGVTINDGGGSTTAKRTIPGISYTVDFLEGGKGVAFGKSAELAGTLDIAFTTRFRGGIDYVLLSYGTDLNEILSPGFYRGGEALTYMYSNSPIFSYSAATDSYAPPHYYTFQYATFVLEVKNAGNSETELHQRLTAFDKTKSVVYERFYIGEGDNPSSWGDWVCTSDFDGRLLWSGALQMGDTDMITLNESVSKQRTGVVVVFSLFDASAAKDQEFSEFFIPKYTIKAHSGKGRSFNLSNAWRNGVKYLYLYDDKIEGNERNVWTNHVVGGITYNNSKFVLRYVIGV